MLSNSHSQRPKAVPFSPNNTADCLHLHLDWLHRGQEHAGIVVSDQNSIGETVRRLLNLLNSVTAEEMRNTIRWLQAFK